MAAPAERILHGSIATPVMTDYRVRTSVRDLDRGQIDYMTDQRGRFTRGAQCADFPGLYIQDIEERNAAGDVAVTLEVEGLESGSFRQVALTWSEDPTGWDIATEERIALRSAVYQWRAVLPGFPNVRLMKQDTREELNGVWSRRMLQYKGIKRAGLVSRRIAVNENIVNPSQPITVSLAPTIPTAENVSVSFPRVTITETIKTTVPPPTNLIPGIVIGPPLSGYDFPPVQIFSITGSDLTANWPYGWKYADIQSEELYAGAGLYLMTVTYEYAWRRQF